MRELSDPIYNNEDAAREHLESIRWPDGPVCPHCGALEAATKLTGKSTRPGVYKCKECRKPFSVTVGTVYERSHIPLHKWLLANHLLCSSKKGISAHQLHRMLQVQYKTAWFMAHRIREAMKEPAWPGPLGGEGKTVEADETFIGNKPGRKVRRSFHHKNAVAGLVERGGKTRLIHIEKANAANLRKVLVTQVDRKSTLMTDEAGYYSNTGTEFAKHETVNHSQDEYVRGEAHTNTIEGVFSIFKRGMLGIYQHCGEQHLKRYLTEFGFRYNHRAALKINDEMRAEAALKGIEGRRLTYRRVNNPYRLA
jgi:transposase-like protein